MPANRIHLLEIISMDNKFALATEGIREILTLDEHFEIIGEVNNGQSGGTRT